jgi:hypothetical protein
MSSKQLNPFELKSTITSLLNKINSVEDIKNCLDDFEMLDSQEDIKVISKVLFKELTKSSVEKIPVICFMLEHFLPKDELVNKLWEVLKNQNLNTEVKITVLNLLRELDADWSYETCEEYLDDAQSLLDENTKRLLNSAIINPEVQIDFMDFLATINTQDKITLINSFSQDFTFDALANILIPVFESEPNSAVGLEALKLLGDTKSQLAFHVLSEMGQLATGELAQRIKKSLSTIKIAGVREDNTKEFYKKILSNSKPYKFYVTYPDGHGDMALIFTRITNEEKIRFVSIVINVDSGIKDCFGFFEISKFECSKILERFLRDEKTVDIDASSFKTILYNAELTTIKNNQNKWKLPYEYICWKNLLIDIEFESQTLDEVLTEQVCPDEVDSSAIDELVEMGISKRWFLDYQYSDEFELLLKDLQNNDNLDDVIKSYYDKVFCLEEKISWVQKLLMCGYIKFAIGKEKDAQLIFGVAQEEYVQKLLFNEILKRSVYEYLLSAKYNKDVPRYGLTIENIDDKIKYIENEWVKHV